MLASNYTLTCISYENKVCMHMNQELDTLVDVLLPRDASHNIQSTLNGYSNLNVDWERSLPFRTDQHALAGELHKWLNWHELLHYFLRMIYCETNIFYKLIENTSYVKEKVIIAKQIYINMLHPWQTNKILKTCMFNNNEKMALKAFLWCLFLHV